MAMRRRTIQHEIWQDTDFGKLAPLAQLIFIGLITQADDEGRLNGHPTIVASMLFPYRTVSLDDVMDALSEIECKMKNILFYTVDDQVYIQFQNWLKHQTLRQERIIPSIFPAPIFDSLPQNAADCGEMRRNVGRSKISKVSKLSKGSNAAAAGGDEAAAAPSENLKIYSDRPTPIKSACDKVREELEAKGFLKKRTLL